MCDTSCIILSLLPDCLMSKEINKVKKLLTHFDYCIEDDNINLLNSKDFYNNVSLTL